MDDYEHVGGEDCDLFSLELPKSTPVLYEEDAVNFEEKIKQGLKNPTHLISTPKLTNLKNIIEG